VLSSFGAEEKHHAAQTGGVTDQPETTVRETSGRGFSLGGLQRAGLRLAGNSRANAAAVRRFSSTRRRDVRFRTLPYGRWELLNRTALAFSAILLAMLLLDPFLAIWRDSLPRPVESAFKFLTRAGQSDWILIGTALFFVGSLGRDAAASPGRAHLRHWARAAAAGYVFLAVALSGIVAVVLKYAIGRARPRHFEEVGAFSFRLGEFDPSWASFPSGHATTAMALGVALALLFPRVRGLWLCAGFWVAFSRVVTGAHYPSDLLAGCLLGAAFSLLLARAFARRRLVFRFTELGALLPRRPEARGWPGPEARQLR
jgi:undecaprenyl-diphosphatase